jgi:hypothetical protein
MCNPLSPADNRPSAEWSANSLSWRASTPHRLSSWTRSIRLAPAEARVEVAAEIAKCNARCLNCSTSWTDLKALRISRYVNGLAGVSRNALKPPRSYSGDHGYKSNRYLRLGSPAPGQNRSQDRISPARSRSKGFYPTYSFEKGEPRRPVLPITKF